VRWFKADIFLVIVLILFLTNFTLKRVVDKANVVHIVIGLAMWIIFVPMFTLAFYMPVALATGTAWWDVVALLPSACTTPIRLGGEWVGFANGLTIVSLLFLHPLTCFYMSPK